jgi:hypothetical protein
MREVVELAARIAELERRFSGGNGGGKLDHGSGGIGPLRAE